MIQAGSRHIRIYTTTTRLGRRVGTGGIISALRGTGRSYIGPRIKTNYMEMYTNELGGFPVADTVF
jgi:hypothetical protein